MHILRQKSKIFRGYTENMDIPCDLIICKNKLNSISENTDQLQCGNIKTKPMCVLYFWI